MRQERIGFCLTGSFCTFEPVLAALARLCREYESVQPILSGAAGSIDSRFGAAAEFRENRARLAKMDEVFQDDPLFRQIDHVFAVKLETLLHELSFCSPAELGDVVYFTEMHGRITALTDDLRELNRQFSDYMYSLTRADYEDTSQALAEIRLSVESMAEVTGQYSAQQF